MKNLIITPLLLSFPLAAFAINGGASWIDYQRETSTSPALQQQPLNGPEAEAYYDWRDARRRQQNFRNRHKESQLLSVMLCASMSPGTSTEVSCGDEIETALRALADKNDIDASIELAETLGAAEVLKIVRSEKGESVSWQDLVNKDQEKRIKNIYGYHGEVIEALRELADAVENVVVAKILEGQKFSLDADMVDIVNNPHFTLPSVLKEDLARLEREYAAHKKSEPESTRLYAAMYLQSGNRQSSAADAVDYFLENRELYHTNPGAFLKGYDQAHSVKGYEKKKTQFKSFLSNCLSSLGKECKSTYLKDLSRGFNRIEKWVAHQEHTISFRKKLKEKLGLNIPLRNLNADRSEYVPPLSILKDQVRRKHDMAPIVQYLNQIDAEELVR